MSTRTLTPTDFMSRQESVTEVQQVRRSCGRLTWRDCVMMTLEGSSTTAGIVLLFYSLPISGCFFGVSVASCCVHMCWRRDASIADMSRLATQIGQNTTAMGSTIVKIHQTGKHIQKDVEGITQERKELQSVSEEMEAQEGVGEIQIHNMQASRHSLVESSSQLNLKIVALEGQVQQLKSILKMLKEHFQHSQEENEKLKSKIGDFSKEMLQMTRLESGFKKILTNIGRELQPEITELSQHVVASQRSYEETFAQLNAKNVELIKEIEKIKGTVKDLEHIDQSIGEKTQQLERLEKETGETMKEFHKVKEEFSEVTEALERMRKQFSDQTKEIQSLERGLRKERTGLEHVGSDLNATANRLEKSESQLEELLKSYSAMNSNLDKQIQEIDKL